MTRQRERENSVKEEARVPDEHEACKVVQKSMWATQREPTRRSSNAMSGFETVSSKARARAKTMMRRSRYEKEGLTPEAVRRWHTSRKWMRTHL